MESHPPAKEIASPPLNAATPPEHPVTHDQGKSQSKRVVGKSCLLSTSCTSAYVHGIIPVTDGHNHRLSKLLYTVWIISGTTALYILKIIGMTS